jgi:hypothetical protein
MPTNSELTTAVYLRYRYWSSKLCSISTRVTVLTCTYSCPSARREDKRRSEGIVPLILKTGTTTRWVVRLKIRPLYSQEQLPRYLLYRMIKKSLCTWWLQYKKTRKTQCIRTIPTQLIIRIWPSQNIFGMWTVLYWTQSSRTQFDVSINVWRLAGDTLNITCNFLYCNHQVHSDVLIAVYRTARGTNSRHGRPGKE